MYLQINSMLATSKQILTDYINRLEYLYLLQTATGPILAKPERRRSYEKDQFGIGQALKEAHSWTPDEYAKQALLQQAYQSTGNRNNK